MGYFFLAKSPGLQLLYNILPGSLSLGVPGGNHWLEIFDHIFNINKTGLVMNVRS